MTTAIPDDAQRSDDGQWWWDGQQWQPVEGAGGDTAGGTGGAGDSGQSGQLSDDGNYRWDGQQWQPVDQGGDQGGHGGQGGDQQGAAQPIDWWGQYPTIMTLLTSNDVNDYYQKLGIDPQSLEADASAGN